MIENAKRNEQNYGHKLLLVIVQYNLHLLSSCRLSRVLRNCGSPRADTNLNIQHHITAAVWQHLWNPLPDCKYITVLVIGRVAVDKHQKCGHIWCFSKRLLYAPFWITPTDFVNGSAHNVYKINRYKQSKQKLINWLCLTLVNTTVITDSQSRPPHNISFSNCRRQDSRYSI